MICYQDERTVEKPTCSDEELQAVIDALEIKNFGHVIDHDHLMDIGEEHLPLFDIWNNNKE